MDDLDDTHAFVRRDDTMFYCQIDVSGAMTTMGSAPIVDGDIRSAADQARRNSFVPHGGPMPPAPAPVIQPAQRGHGLARGGLAALVMIVMGILCGSSEVAVLGVFLAAGIIIATVRNGTTPTPRPLAAAPVQPRIDTELLAEADQLHDKVSDAIAESLTNVEMQLTKPDLWANRFGPADDFWEVWNECQLRFIEAHGPAATNQDVTDYAHLVSKSMTLWQIAVDEAGNRTLDLEQKAKLGRAKHAYDKAVSLDKTAADGPEAERQSARHESEVAWATVAKTLLDVLGTVVKPEARESLAELARVKGVPEIAAA